MLSIFRYFFWSNKLLSIPTDSFYKFIAIGSIASMVLLIDICLKNYEKAELAYISAIVKAHEFQDRYKVYSSHVNKALEIHNKAAAKGSELTDIEIQTIASESDKASQKSVGMDELSYELLDVGYKADLYRKIKIIWILITSITALACAFSAFVGFKGWYLSEKVKPTS